MKRIIWTVFFLIATAMAAARNVYPLNEDWTFYFRSENSSDDARYVSLPHTWNRDALAGNSEYRRTTANYMRKMYVPADWASQRLFLRFGGVQTVADVFVNGRHVGEHRGGFTGFTFEITPYVKFGAENYIMVVVSNTFQNDVLPTSSEQNVYGGIYRSVELIATDQLAIRPDVCGTDGVFVQQNAVGPESVQARTAVYVSDPKRTNAGIIRLTVRDPSGAIVVRKQQKANNRDDQPVVVPFTIDAPQLWSPSEPNLYTVTVRIEGDGQQDEVTATTGFRRIDTAHRGLVVNGDTIHIQGVNLYHDRTRSANAFLKEDYDEDLAHIADVGANAIHSVSGPHAQYLYDRCDREGIMAWIDLPLTRSPYLGDVSYFPTERFRRNGEEQLAEIVAQNFNHPSVVMWGIFSLLWQRGDDAIPYLRTLNARAKKIDPSRPTVALSDQDGDINFITDLIVFRQEVGWMRGSTDDLGYWCRSLHESWSNLLAGISYGVPGYPAQQDDKIDRPAPATHWLPERWQTRFHEAYAKNLAADSCLWGTWVNAMFDFGTARGTNDRYACGLMTLDRREKKDSYYLYRTLWNRRRPTLYIAERRWRVRPDTVQQIRIYSSAEAPQLTVNGDSVALEKTAPGVYQAQCSLRTGDNAIVARNGELQDSIGVRIGSALKTQGSEALRKTKDRR